MYWLYLLALEHRFLQLIDVHDTLGNTEQCRGSFDIRGNDILSFVSRFFRVRRLYSSRSCSQVQDQDGELDNDWNVLPSQRINHFVSMPL